MTRRRSKLHPLPAERAAETLPTRRHPEHHQPEHTEEPDQHTDLAAVRQKPTQDRSEQRNTNDTNHDTTRNGRARALAQRTRLMLNPGMTGEHHDLEFLQDICEVTRHLRDVAARLDRVAHRRLAAARADQEQPAPEGLHLVPQARNERAGDQASG